MKAPAQGVGLRSSSLFFAIAMIISAGCSGVKDKPLAVANVYNDRIHIEFGEGVKPGTIQVDIGSESMSFIVTDSIEDVRLLLTEGQIHMRANEPAGIDGRQMFYTMNQSIEIDDSHRNLRFLAGAGSSRKEMYALTEYIPCELWSGDQILHDVKVFIREKQDMQ